MTQDIPLLLDVVPETDSVIDEIISGLTGRPKTLPSKYFYDARGSELFDQICELDEYYPTRTEQRILEDNLDEITALIGPNAVLVEYGSGSSTKTQLLLGALSRPKTYVPIDISRDHLLAAAARLTKSYPQISILPVCADYSQELRLGIRLSPGSHTTVFFPGSTIGNFEPHDAISFLTRIAKLVGRDGGLLIGVDLKKDRKILESAYNDSRGVTAAFNLNMLNHINHRAETTFDSDLFRHRAIYNDVLGRIEMHLFVTEDHNVTVGGELINLAEGESICTEYSHKYDPDEFADMSKRAGFTVERVWTDRQMLFSLQYLRAV